MIDATTELQHAVEDAAAHLYVWSLKDIPQDLRDALKSAAGRETSVAGHRGLHPSLPNVRGAVRDGNLVRPGTGHAEYTVPPRHQLPLHPARLAHAAAA